MLKKFKLWIYNFIYEGLLNDATFISALFNRLQEEQKERDRIKEEARKAKIDAEQRARAEEYIVRRKKIQDNCSHAKGGRGSTNHRDYAIWFHTFPDGTSTVQCLICQKEWKGAELKSEEVRFMLKNTTNTPTSSEVPVDGNKKDRTEPYFIPEDKEGDERMVEERKNNPLWPFASRGYVKYWDKMYKKLTRKKKKEEKESK